MIGAGLLVAAGPIHLDLYLTGYRTIPTIGWLFLVQMITAFALGAIVLVSSNRVASAIGGGFAVATLGGYLLSLRVGLFGFREVRTSAGIAPGVIEVTTFAALSTLVLRPLLPRELNGMKTIGGPIEKLGKVIPPARWTAGVIGLLVAVLLGISLVATGPPSTSAGSSMVVLKATTIRGGSVLTNARGYTLYWFAPDTSSKSTCYGTCAAYWPRTGSPIAGAGVTGELGTISRNGGAQQATYDRHPLYTYVGDSSPGQANGNNINLNGGVWHEMAVSG